MRIRYWMQAILVILLIGAVSGCAGSKDRSGGTPAPVKTLRPTFTPTAALPTAPPASATPQATDTPQPSSTPLPPTDAPTPTPEPATLTIQNATVNVRGGPGTNYARIGQVAQGQTFPITGKNASGDWWQFEFEGGAGWISASMVSTSRAETVQIASDIPAAPPTSRPQPTAIPQPTATPVPVWKFAQITPELRNADNTNFDVLTFWGRLGNTSQPAISGYRLRVTGPSGDVTVDFATTWQWAYGGTTAAFLYNAKVEMPRAAGNYRAVVVDGSGQEVSDAITGSVIDRTHDALLSWWLR